MSGAAARGRRGGHTAIVAYVAWAIACITVVLAKDGLSADNVTHLGIGAYLAITWMLRGRLRAQAGKAPGRFFVGACTFSAAVVETCYMISAPLHPSLRIDSALAAPQALRNLGVDLALTLPAYLVIFTALWLLLRRYPYRRGEFVLLTSAGQALGDASAFLAAQPAMLLFLPWLMLNYQAMTLVPTFLVPPASRMAGPWMRVAMYVVPLAGIPLLYGIVGTAIVYAGRAIGWIP